MTELITVDRSLHYRAASAYFARAAHEPDGIWPAPDMKLTVAVRAAAQVFILLQRAGVMLAAYEVRAGRLCHVDVIQDWMLTFG